MNFRLRQSVVAVTGALLLTTGLSAMADSTTDIVNALISKGVLTEEEGALLIKGRTGEKESAEKKAKDQASVKVGKKGLEVESGDGNFSLKLGGRMHADVTSFQNDDNLRARGPVTNVTPLEATSGTEIRRGRIALSGTLYKDFDYIIETDFSGNATGVRDLFVNYRGFKPLEITVGHQKHAMSMEIQESSNDIMFNERSAVQALTLPYFDRAIGVNLKTSGDNWNVQGGVYGDSVSPQENGSVGRSDEGGGWGLRGTFAPINEENRLVHFGANIGQRKTNDANNQVNSNSPAFALRTANNSGLSLSNTGNITGLDKVTLGILEFSAMYGPLSFQSEFAQAKAEREQRSDLDFNAFYVQAGYSLTGESRTYKGSDGEFKRLKPKNNFSLEKGTWGAWEVAARYDQLDLVDEDILGGEQKRVSLNLNWYMNENVRLLAGYTRTFDLENSPIVKANGDQPDSIDLLTLRTQFAF